MHYYQFNIKDYSFATMRLSLLEDLAFRRMLDHHYESEKPLPFELEKIARTIGMRENQEEIRQILNEFWTETESGWVNERALFEIGEYQEKADRARANGKKGGRPKNPDKTESVISKNPDKTESVNLANPDETGSKANHKPLTNNHKLNIYSELIEDGFNHWWNLYPSPRRTNKKGCFEKFKAKCKKLNEDEITDLVNIISNDIVKKKESVDDIKFMPQTTTYLNQERWNDGE